MGFSIHSGKRTWLHKKRPVLRPLLISASLVFFFALIGHEAANPGIGVVQINGVITESETYIQQIKKLETNPRVKGIIVRINSPGGAVAPSQEVYLELSRVQTIKPVYASISSVAASGGYYIALGAEKIVANEGSITGSIGVILQSFNVSELFEKIGIRSEVIKSGKNKDLGSIFRKMKLEERNLLKSVIEDTHQQFVEAVAKSRNLDINKVRPLADGRVFTGRQAHKLGLVDEIGTYRQTIAQLKKKLNLTGDVDLITPIDELDELFGSFNPQGVLRMVQNLVPTGILYLFSP